MIGLGLPLVGFCILSARDNPLLNTSDAVLAALPTSIRLLFIDDIEYLLLPDQRNPRSVLHLIGRIRQYAAERGIRAAVTSGIGLDEVIHGGGL